MPPATAKRIAALLAAGSGLDADGADNLRESMRLLQAALETENHGAIAEHDREVEFVAQACLIEIIHTALREGDSETARLLVAWGEGRIPPDERAELVELLLADADRRAAR